MHYFFAASGHSEVKRLIRLGVKKLLLSFAFHDKAASWDYLKAHPDCLLMIDSGAYTVWQSGKAICLSDYLRFCDELRIVLPTRKLQFVSLDVIPQNDSYDEVQSVVEESISNYEKMLAEGFDTMPVFHQGENFQVFEHYRKTAQVIGVSGDNKASSKQRAVFFDEVYYSFRDTVKTHGFGHGSKSFMFNYPFYSVDSTNYKRVHNGRYSYEGTKLNGSWSTDKHLLFRESVSGFIDMERHATELWESRGVVWKD